MHSNQKSSGRSHKLNVGQSEALGGRTCSGLGVAGAKGGLEVATAGGEAVVAEGLAAGTHGGAGGVALVAAPVCGSAGNSVSVWEHSSVAGELHVHALPSARN
jgi:hypothetical protein